MEALEIYFSRSYLAIMTTIEETEGGAGEKVPPLSLSFCLEWGSLLSLSFSPSFLQQKITKPRNGQLTHGAAAAVMRVAAPLSLPFAAQLRGVRRQKKKAFAPSARRTARLARRRLAERGEGTDGMWRMGRWVCANV